MGIKYAGIGRYAAPAVYLLTAFLIMLPLLGPGYFLALDMQWGPNSFSAWNFGDFYGFAPSSYGAYFPVRMVLAAFSELAGVELTEKLFLMAILFVCGFSMHSSLPKEHGNARYFAGLLYMLNPFVFARFLAGHWSVLFSYSLWPIALLMFSDFLQNPRGPSALAKAALITTLAAVSSHGVVMLLLAYALMAAFHILKTGLGRALLSGIAALAALTLALNLFWIAPTILLFGGVYEPASAEAYLHDFTPFDEGMSAGAALITMHGFWRFGFLYTKDVLPIWPILFLAIAAVAFIGFLSILREKAFLALFFLSLFLVAFLLSLGQGSPLSFIFTIFGDSLPLYFMFRDSQKFVGLMCLAYSALGSYGVHDILTRHKGKARLLLPLLIAIPVLFNFGFFGFFGQIRLTEYPSDWVDADRIIAADPIQSSILFLPPWLYNHYPWANNTQKTLAMPARHFFSRPSISDRGTLTENVAGDIKDPRSGYFDYIFRNRQNINNTGELLAPLNVRYVVLLKGNDYTDHYLWLFRRITGPVGGMELVYESDSLYLFRNNKSCGPFLASDDDGSGSYAELVYSGTGISGCVPYRMITPAAYVLGPSQASHAVFASAYGDFLYFEGVPVTMWHGVSGSIAQSRPGTLINALFYAVCALFLFSWLAALALLANPPRAAIALLLAAFALLYFIIIWGLAGPAQIGALLAASVFVALSVSSYGHLRALSETFLKVR